MTRRQIFKMIRNMKVGETLTINGHTIVLVRDFWWRVDGACTVNTLLIVNNIQRPLTETEQ